LYYILHWSSGMNWEAGGVGGIPERIKHKVTFPPIRFSYRQRAQVLSAGMRSDIALKDRWAEPRVGRICRCLVTRNNWSGVKSRSTLHGHRGLLRDSPVCLTGCVVSWRLDLCCL
jgi:hypothetical protein